MVVMTALAALAIGAPPAHAAPRLGATVEIQTVPAVSGMRFAYAGRTFRADRLGRVRISPAPSRVEDVRVLESPVSHGVRAGLDHWYPRQGTVAVAFFHRVRPRFIDLQGKEVNPRSVQEIVMKAVRGGEYTFKGDEARWVQVSRVVQKVGRFRSKSLQYNIEKAVVKGSNVVNAGQQRVRPAKTPVFPIQLLLYSARFKTRDAFFGFPIGSGVRLEYPNGRVERYDLSDNGELLLPSLPRSDYNVTVDGPGFSFSRPLALSRNQEVELEVLSYLDVGLALFVLTAFAVGLPLIRRPELRARIRRSINPRPVLAGRRPSAPGRDL
jgi:hypothetical protein